MHVCYYDHGVNLKMEVLHSESLLSLDNILNGHCVSNFKNLVIIIISNLLHFGVRVCYIFYENSWLKSYCQKGLSQLKDNAIDKRNSVLAGHLRRVVVKYFENFTGSFFDGNSDNEKTLSQMFTCDIWESFQNSYFDRITPGNCYWYPRKI